MPKPAHSQENATLEAWEHLCRVHSAVARKVEGELTTTCGVNLATFTVLRHLSGAPGGRSRLSALVEDVSLTKSGVSRLVDRLERAGLITTEGCPSDGRGSFAVLADQGRRVVERANEIFAMRIGEALDASLNPKDVATLGALLQKIGSPVS